MSHYQPPNLSKLLSSLIPAPPSPDSPPLNSTDFTDKTKELPNVLASLLNNMQISESVEGEVSDALPIVKHPQDDQEDHSSQASDSSPPPPPPGRQNPKEPLMPKLITLKSLITFYTKAIERLASYEPTYLNLPDIPQELLSHLEEDADRAQDDNAAANDNNNNNASESQQQQQQQQSLSYHLKMRNWLKEQLQKRKAAKQSIKDVRKQIAILRRENDAKLQRNQLYGKVYGELKRNIMPPLHFTLFPQHFPEMDSRARFLCPELIAIYNKLALFTKSHKDFQYSFLSLEGDTGRAQEQCERILQESDSGNVSASPSQPDGDAVMEDVENAASSPAQEDSSSRSHSPPRKRRRLNSSSATTASESEVSSTQNVTYPTLEEDIFPLHIVLRMFIPNVRAHPKITFYYSTQRKMVLVTSDLPSTAKDDRFSAKGESVLQCMYDDDLGTILPQNGASPVDTQDQDSPLSNSQFGKPYMWAQILASLSPRNLTPTQKEALDSFSVHDMIGRFQKRYLELTQLEEQIEMICNRKLKLSNSLGVPSLVNIKSAKKHYEKDCIRLEALLRYFDKSGPKFFAEVMVHIKIPRWMAAKQVGIAGTEPNQGSTSPSSTDGRVATFSLKLTKLHEKTISLPSEYTSLPQAKYFDSKKVQKSQRLKLQTQLNDIELYINHLYTSSLTDRFFELSRSISAFFLTRKSDVRSVNSAHTTLRISKHSEYGKDAAKGVVWSKGENLFTCLPALGAQDSPQQGTESGVVSRD